MNQKIVQTLITGLVDGSVFALVAVGFSLVFSTTRIVNFAQGALLVVGGYTCYVLSDPGRMNLPIWVSLLLVTLFSALVGLVSEFLALGFMYPRAILANAAFFVALAFGILMAFSVDETVLKVFYVAVFPLMVRAFIKAATHRPITQLDPAVNMGWIITTFSVNILALEIIRMRIDAEPHALPKLVSSIFGWNGSRVSGVPITPTQIAVILTALILVLAVELLQNRTWLGKAFQAVAQDKTTASLMGINPAVVVAMTFAVAGMLAAIAAVVLGGDRNIALTDGSSYAIYAFMAAVIGGLGSTRGALIGGLILGLVGAFFPTFSTTTAPYKDLALFVVFMLVLMLRPQGLFGQPLVEKV